MNYLEQRSKEYASTLIVMDMVSHDMLGRHIINDIAKSFSSLHLLFCSSYDCGYLSYQIRRKYKHIITSVLQKPFYQKKFIDRLLECFNMSQINYYTSNRLQA